MITKFEEICDAVLQDIENVGCEVDWETAMVTIPGYPRPITLETAVTVIFAAGILTAVGRKARRGMAS